MRSLVVCAIPYFCPRGHGRFWQGFTASRRHFNTHHEDCFQISIRLLWPHTFSTQDLEHARVDSLGFALTDTFEDTISGKPSQSPPKRHLASLHEDGMPKFTASCSDVAALARASFICVHVLNFGVAHMISSALRRVRHERLSVAGWQVVGLLRQERESDGSFTCLVSVSATATRPCPPRTRLHSSHRHHCGHRRRRGLIHESHVLLVWKSTFRHMYASTFMRPCTVWLNSETCSRARHGESTLGGKCSRHSETSSVLQQSSPAISLYWQALRRKQHHLNRRRRVVGKTSSDIHAAITWMSVHFKGQLWRDVRSLCRCFLLAVLPTNILKHPHHWRPCPRTGQCSWFSGASSSIREYLVLVTRSEVLRDGSIDHFWESFIAGEHEVLMCL